MYSQLPATFAGSRRLPHRWPEPESVTERGRYSDTSMGSPGKSMTGDQPNDDGSHLADVPDGCGCAEMWELLSEQRGEGTTDEDGE